MVVNFVLSSHRVSGEYGYKRERMFKELSSMEGVKPYPIHKEPIKHGVLVRDVSYLPMLKNCLRVSVGLPEENDAFLEALYKVLKRIFSKFYAV